MVKSYILKEDGNIEEFQIENPSFDSFKISSFEENHTLDSFYMVTMISDTNSQLALLMDENNDYFHDENAKLKVNKTLDRLTNGKLKCVGNVLLVKVEDPLNSSQDAKFVDLEIDVEKLFGFMDVQVRNFSKPLVDSYSDVFVAGSDRYNTFYIGISLVIRDPGEKHEIEKRENCTQFFARVGIKI